jgi:hypothetical protein
VCVCVRERDTFLCVCVSERDIFLCVRERHVSVCVRVRALARVCALARVALFMQHATRVRVVACCLSGSATFTICV